MFEGISWNPLEFLSLMLALLFLLLLFSRKWNLSHNKGKQAQPFISGNLEQHGMQVRASNIYWGFFEALKDYYRRMDEMHSNSINDYVYWMVIVMALALLLLGVS